MGRSESASSYRTLLLLHAGFAYVGVATVVLGPAIPELAAAWGVAPARLAGLFSAQFLVSSLGSVLSSLHPWRSARTAYPMIALGLLGLAWGGPGWALAAAGVLGLGLGLGIPASNLLVAAAHPGRRGAALSFLNLLWGVGAVVCPLLFAALRDRVAVPATLTGLAVVSLLFAAGLLLVRRPAVADGAAVVRGGGATVPLRRELPGLLLFGGMLFLYVGAENAVGGWLVTLADQLGGATAASMLVHSAYWGALLAGRAVAPPLLRRMRETTLYAVSLAVAAVGVGGLLAAPTRPVATLAAAVCGLGMAGIFPLTVSALTAATARSGARRVGWVFAFGGIGGAVLPWLVAAVAAPGSIERGFLVPLAALGVLALLLAAHRAGVGRPAAATAAPG